MDNWNDQVFVNCPFDEGYKPIFDAIVFTITDLGFVARSAREEDDAGQFRLEKIQNIIAECKFGVHDLSAVQLDPPHGLPRFNMPLELGLFLGCKRYGGLPQSKKISLIFDTEPHRFRIFISDIAGQDIHAHNRSVEIAISELRSWLATASKRKELPGGQDIFKRYQRFLAELPEICAELRLQPAEVTFPELRQMIKDWLKRRR